MDEEKPMKGFKDKNNKFHPINNNKTIKHKSRSSKGMKLKQQYLPLTQKQRIAVLEGLGTDDFVILDHNKFWKLVHIAVSDGSEFYVFPDEDSALKFGIQSIRATASDYIPEKGSENYNEWKDLEGEELVDKIIEELSEYGQRSQLGAIAQHVASYDGQYTELSDGSIVFQIS